MNFEISETNGTAIAELIVENAVLQTTQDAVELVMNAIYQGADCLIVHQKHLPEAFFELKTGMAGDMLQKFSTYGARLAIVGSFEQMQSESLQAFIRESNRMGRINFVDSVSEAKKLFGRQGR